MAICIPEQLLDSVKKIVTESSSITREQKLIELFGNKDTAKQINNLYENSLLLKNQRRAIEKFVDDISGVSIEKKAEMKEAIAKRLANRSEKIQSEELLSISQDIFNKKYKLDIPLEDVQKLSRIKGEADTLKLRMEGTPAFSPERTAYGLKSVEMKNIIDGLKNPNSNLGPLGALKELGKNTINRIKDAPDVLSKLDETRKIAWEAATSVVYKGVQASADISYALRQGFKVLTKDPKTWANNMLEAFKPFTKINSLEQIQATRELWEAKLISHPLYDQAIDAGLSLGVHEDFFPPTVIQRIPGLGNIFKASDEAFTIFTQGSRMGLFEEMTTRLAKEGIEITPKVAKDLAYVANSITGRGSLGKLETVSGTINKLFFSGRYISSAVDTFTMPFNSKLDAVARHEAMKSSLSNLSTIAALMYTASLFTEVETDWRSSKFGKMLLPGSDNTWIDLTAGLGSYITLAGKQIEGETKNATTGKITKLNDPNAYKGQTRFDVGVNWLTGKLAPVPSAVVTHLKGSDFTGKKPTLGSSVKNMVTPITVQNAIETASDEEIGTTFLSTMFDALGASSNNYGKYQK